jgi:hypothetical protein
VKIPDETVPDEISFAGRRSQQSLVAIHDHLREELDRLGDMVDQLLTHLEEEETALLGAIGRLSLAL